MRSGLAVDCKILQAKVLASVTGEIISMSIATGLVTRLVTMQESVCYVKLSLGLV